MEYLITIKGVIGEDVKVNDILMHLNAAKDYTHLKLLIDSPGGWVDEGERIVGLLENSGKFISAVNIGDIMSQAVDIFLTAQVREFNPNKGEFLIHNPWASVEGEGADLIASGKELIKIEDAKAKVYADKIGADYEIIRAVMSENIPLTPEQIESFGFAKIVKPEVKAVAYFKLNKMDEKVVNEKLGAIEALMLKVASYFKPKNMVVNDVNGNELDFGAEITDIGQVVVGVTATVNGSPAQGDYQLPDGRLLVFEAGTLIEIKEPEGDDEMAKLKAENEELKSKIAEMEKATNEVVSEFKAFKAMYKKPDQIIPTPSGQSNRKKLFI